MHYDELFDIVDKEGNVVGQAPRRECHNNPGLIHRAVHVFVWTSSGQLILQYRPPYKDIQPDKWDLSVGGHLDVGEEPLAAAIREMAEELGIKNQPVTFLYSYLWQTDRESELVSTYRLTYDGPLHPHPTEVIAVKSWSVAEIEAQLGQGVFTPNFEHEWVRYQQTIKKENP